MQGLEINSSKFISHCETGLGQEDKELFSFLKVINII